MRCYICEEQAVNAPNSADSEWVDCEGCGRYGVTGSALALMRQNVRVFNVPRSRDWFALERSRGVDRPIIDTFNTLWD